MKQHKGFGSPPKTRAFQISVLETPAPGVYVAAVSTPSGRCVVTATPMGFVLSNEQLARINPGTLRWLAQNKESIGQRLYAGEVQS